MQAPRWAWSLLKKKKILVLWPNFNLHPRKHRVVTACHLTSKNLSSYPACRGHREQSPCSHASGMPQRYKIVWPHWSPDQVATGSTDLPSLEKGSRAVLLWLPPLSSLLFGARSTCATVKMAWLKGHRLSQSAIQRWIHFYLLLDCLVLSRDRKSVV